MVMTTKPNIVRFRRSEGVRLFHHHTYPLALLLAGLIIACHQSAVTDAFCPRTLDHRRCSADCRITHRLSYLPTKTCRISSPSVVAPPPNNSKVLLQGFLDGLFGGGESETDKQNAILETYDIQGVDSKDVDRKFDSLSDYITNKWIGLFVSGTIKLTTPVRVSKSSETVFDRNDESATTSGTESIDDVEGCRLVFQKIDTGYKSKEEEGDEPTKGNDKTKTSSKQEDTKQGGVEILVQKISNDSGRQSLRVVARRCQTDEDTMIREMSEEIIVGELKNAIDVWKKETV